MPSSSRRRAGGSTCAPRSTTAWPRSPLPTRAWASPRRIRRRSSRSSVKWGRRTRRSRGPGSGWPCPGSSLSYMADGSGCRANQGRDRRSRSRCPRADRNRRHLLARRSILVPASGAHRRWLARGPHASSRSVIVTRGFALLLAAAADRLSAMQRDRDSSPVLERARTHHVVSVDLQLSRERSPFVVKSQGVAADRALDGAIVLSSGRGKPRRSDHLGPLLLEGEGKPAATRPRRTVDVSLPNAGHIDRHQRLVDPVLLRTAPEHKRRGKQGPYGSHRRETTVALDGPLECD